MAGKKNTEDSINVDKGLIVMFLKMSPDERLLANDNMIRTIVELRNAYKQRKTNSISLLLYQAGCLVELALLYDQSIF